MRHNHSKYLAILLGVGVAVVLPACTDLTETPYEEVTQANFNPTSRDIATLVGAAYTPLRPLWMGWQGNIDLQEESSDELITPVRPNGWFDGGTYLRMHEHVWDSHQWQPENLYNNCFRGINAASRVIYQIDSGIVPVDDAVKESLPAELRALRAYYYYLLLNNHGSVPIVSNFASKEVPQQASRQDVYNFVVSELTEVIPKLSEETGGAMYGRINKWAALAILARTYLNAEVYTGTPQWDKVIETTQQIIDAKKYELDADYRTPFARNNNEASREDMWLVPYDSKNATESSFHMKTLKPALEQALGLAAQPWGGSASTPQFIDTYDPDDGRLADTWLMGPVFNDQGDGYDFVETVPSMAFAEFNQGFPVWKYEIYSGETGASDVDFPIVRYAEVLMMKAEALLRTGKADQAAAIVTQVRQRDFADTDPSKATVTGAELMEGSSYNYGWQDKDGVIKTGPDGTPVVDGGADVQYGRFFDELGWEFAVEGHRRTDMIRFGVYTSKSWFNHSPQGDYRALFPIPSDAIQTNPNLKQNPGY